MVVNPDACKGRVPSFYVGGAETFQTPPWKVVFEGWIAPHRHVLFLNHI